MKNVLYFGLGLLFGGGIGATTAYILTKKRLEAEKEAEIAEMRDYYIQKAEAHFVTGTTTTPSEAVEAPVSDFKQIKAKFPSEEEKPSMEAYAAQKGYYNYAKLAESENPQEETGEGENLANPGPDIYEITDEQYVTECLNYEKREFRFYLEDEVLCNEEDEVLEPKYTVTEKAITTLLDKDDGELVYVRNDMLHIDYEIQKLVGSYQEQVLGMYNEEE